MSQQNNPEGDRRMSKTMRIDTAHNNFSERFENAIKTKHILLEAKNQLEITNREDGTREIRILSPLGPDPDFFTTPAEVFAALDGARNVNIVLSSPGGMVTAGRNIAVALRRFRRDGGTVTVDVAALAGSAATYLLAAADRVRLEKDSQVFIHRSEAMVFGNRQVLTDIIAEMDRIDQELVSLYAEWTGNSRDQIEDWIIGENGRGTTFTAEEAVENGFADEILEDTTVSNQHEEIDEPSPEKEEVRDVDGMNEKFRKFQRRMEFDLLS